MGLNENVTLKHTFGGETRQHTSGCSMQVVAITACESEMCIIGIENLVLSTYHLNSANEILGFGKDKHKLQYNRYSNKY